MKCAILLATLSALSAYAAPAIERRELPCTTITRTFTRTITIKVQGTALPVPQDPVTQPSQPSQPEQPVPDSGQKPPCTSITLDSGSGNGIVTIVPLPQSPPPSNPLPSPDPVQLPNPVPSPGPNSQPNPDPAPPNQNPSPNTPLDPVQSSDPEPNPNPLPPQGPTSGPPVTTTSVTAEVSVTTISTTNGTVQILPTCSSVHPSTDGSIITGLNTTGLPTSPPLISNSVSTPTTTISTTAVTSIMSSVVPDTPSDNIFQPIDTREPHMSIASRSDHPVPRLGINQTAPISTNKFYSNFFLGAQVDATWTNPYSLSWAKGGGATNSWGLAVSHIDENQRFFGPQPDQNPVTWFTHPLNIQSLVLTASELSSSAVLTMDHLKAFSANVNLSPGDGQSPVITFPLVQGMGFVTGIYYGGTPVLQSGVLFRSITRVDRGPKPGVTKYRILLEDGKEWLLYATSNSERSLNFQVVNNGLAKATSNFHGIIQIAKNPGNAEDVYDEVCGSYASGVDLSGSVNGDQGSYTLSFKKSGSSQSKLLMWALPHHVQSFSSETSSCITSIKLTTTTKGVGTAVIADAWTLVEDLPTSMKFSPWSPETGSVDQLSDAAIKEIKDIAASEVSQDMQSQTNLDSMYFSGKALGKFAGIVYALHELMDTESKALGQAGLKNLKEAFSTFVQNKQQFPLVYEKAWGGVVSTASYTTGNSGMDFGNTYYNDHHFHYGYFVYTGAIIARLDPTMLKDEAFMSFVTTLVRDIANPSPSDPYFPQNRAYDFYHGHSWAKGLFPSYDGKDQESSSEDMMFAYAIKLWGLATGDSNTIARGNLQLAVTSRSIKNYFLYESDNVIQPSNFIGNKVSGILFENKIDHTTYFGANIEYIQGIHMLPLLPCTALSRSKKFVQEEWETYFSSGRADQIAGGWRGILYGNLGRIDPKTSWEFFLGKNGWDMAWIDGGASRTWYLVMAAALGGAS